MAEQTFALKFKLHSNCDGKRCLCPHRIMPARGTNKKASPKKGQVCSCAMSKATTCDKELGCGNCNRKMTSQKWAKVKKNEDKQWGEEVKASKVGRGGEAESEVTPGGKETPRGEETPGGDDDTEEEEEEEEEEVEEKKVGGAKKQAKGAARGKDVAVVEDEEEEEQIQDEGLAKDVGEDEGLVLLFCS